MTPGPRYADEVRSHHRGRRVSIRYLITDADSQRPTDVVGRLVATDRETFVVQRRDGTEVSVPRDRLVGSRLLPEPPEPR